MNVTDVSKPAAFFWNQLRFQADEYVLLASWPELQLREGQT
jgi:hypothetical protein